MVPAYFRAKRLLHGLGHLRHALVWAIIVWPEIKRFREAVVGQQRLDKGKVA